MTDPVLMHARPDGIAIITINRPEQRNCLSKEVREALFAAWDWFEHDPASRIAILTGAGDKAFCAGGDLKEMDSGMMDPSGRSTTNGGRICGMIATILMAIGALIGIALVALGVLGAAASR